MECSLSSKSTHLIREVGGFIEGIELEIAWSGDGGTLIRALAFLPSALYCDLY